MIDTGKLVLKVMDKEVEDSLEDFDDLSSVLKRCLEVHLVVVQEVKQKNHIYI